ncbi:MAG: hypothetical protein M1837_006021 [Sclerophora amabilis]|nr:MAG: hypothetical protein M1837_006021 [Sclerophora amabilis]
MIVAVFGFKVKRDRLTAFQKSHHTFPGFFSDHYMNPQDLNAMSQLAEKVGCKDCKVRVFVPWVKGTAENTEHVFVCCRWLNIVAYIALDDERLDDVGGPAPPGFQKLRELIDPTAPLGRFLVHNSEENYDLLFTLVVHLHSYVRFPTV